MCSNQREHEEQYNFESAESASPHTYPVQCSTLRENGFVMLRNRPCKIMQMVTSKAGKHGHAKIHFVGLDIFNGKKYEDICPSTHNMDVPYVRRIDYQLINISDDEFLTLLADNGEIREDLKMPVGKLGNFLKSYFAADKDLLCTVLKSCDEELIVAVKPYK